jgi:hypothetical protein
VQQVARIQLARWPSFTFSLEAKKLNVELGKVYEAIPSVGLGKDGVP